ncbi:unnamed protein product [Sphagnum troendelagicum]|uniref:Uncharacterized protein n=1 Tax=Sphagnum troendelagicum TaxID=128251 RepID=A0ABP0TRE3_9BRYO
MAKRENMRALAAFLRVTHFQSRRYSEILEVFVNIGPPRFSVNTGGLRRNWQEMATGSSDFDDDVKAAYG